MRKGWAKDALCRGAPPEMFYDDIEYSTGEARQLAIKVATELCAACPVRLDCAEQVMADEGNAGPDSRYGFVAGMMPKQRARIARRGGLRGKDPLDLIASL